MLSIFQFTDILKKYFFWNSLNQQVLQKLENDLEHFKTFLEQAWHNQRDDGGTLLPELEGLWRLPKKHLCCSFYSIIVLDSE